MNCLVHVRSLSLSKRAEFALLAIHTAFRYASNAGLFTLRLREIKRSFCFVAYKDRINFLQVSVRVREKTMRSLFCKVSI